jgi:hypothetical protein
MSWRELRRADGAPYKIDSAVESTRAKRQTKEKKESQQNRVRSDPDLRRAQGWDLPLAGLFHFTLQGGRAAAAAHVAKLALVGRRFARCCADVRALEDCVGWSVGSVDGQ